MHRFIPTLEGLQGKETYLSGSETVQSDRAVTRDSGDLGSDWSDTASPGCATLVKSPPLLALTLPVCGKEGQTHWSPVATFWL